MVFPSVVRLFFGWGGSERPTGRVAAAVASRGPADVPALPILRPRLRGGLRSDWEAWHGPDDGGWRSEDCSVWLAAVLLHDMGLEPSVVYAEADPEAMF